VNIVYAPAKPQGSRIVSATMADGRPLRDDATYTLVLTNFLVAGGDGLGLAGRALKSEPLGIPDLDALVRYVQSRPQPLRFPFESRLTAALP
jgi:5'-nucleotidase